jgi:membrane protease YdiL (CAAX protease family)
MKNNFRGVVNLLFVVLIIFIFFENKTIFPVKSLFLRQILTYLIWFLIVFISIKYFNKDKTEEFGFSFKTKVSKKVKRNARLIGLTIGFVTNLIMFYTIDFSEYLKGFNIFERISLAIIIGPIAEEIVFRGYIQTAFGIVFAKHKKQKTFWLPIIITSIIFGLLHFTAIKKVSMSQTVGIVFLAVLLGISSGFFKEKYKSIIPSINMHIATNLGGMLVVAFLFAVSSSTVRHKILKRMNQPGYHFNMNDSASFRETLNDFSIYEKNLPDSFIGNYKNISVKIILTIDTSGKINKIEYDTIRNMLNKKIANKEFYKANALEVARKLPQFIPPENLQKDTSIVFYVSY